MKRWFYSSILGGWYLEFLLWLDRRKDKTKFLTPKEMATIIKESSKIADGMVEVRHRLGQLVKNKTTSEYKRVLEETDDIIPLASQRDNSDRSKALDTIRDSYVRKGGTDIVTDTDKAKMIESRIEDMYKLQEDTLRRGTLRAIRKAKQTGDLETASKLEEEFKQKYGRRH